MYVIDETQAQASLSRGKSSQYQMDKGLIGRLGVVVRTNRTPVVQPVACCLTD
jgi:hypothetical protein